MEFKSIEQLWLGWEKSKPYNKEEIYEVAKALNVPLKMLPCAVVCEGGMALPESITKLEGDLTKCFREIFSLFQ